MFIQLVQGEVSVSLLRERFFHKGIYIGLHTLNRYSEIDTVGQNTVCADSMDLSYGAWVHLQYLHDRP